MLDVGDEAQGLVNVRQVLHWDIFLTHSEQRFLLAGLSRMKSCIAFPFTQKVQLDLLKVKLRSTMEYYVCSMRKLSA